MDFNYDIKMNIPNKITYKTCLAINNSPGSQRGIEETFNSNLNPMVNENKIIYFEHDCIKLGITNAINKLIIDIQDYKPDILIFFHIANIKVPDDFVSKLYNVLPKVKIIYDEGDMFGGLGKPMLSHMKKFMKSVDGVFIRGLGDWYKECFKYNKKTIYVPHINSLPLVNENLYKINHKACFVGNKITTRKGPIFRLPGASNREKLVKYLDSHIPDFEIYGKGWGNLKSNKGLIQFDDQALLYNDITYHFSYEHYPKIPLYWSDRMPISLYRGQIYITHEHGLYSQYFKDTKGVFFFKNKQEALEIYKFLLTRNEDDLRELRISNATHAKKIFDSISIYNNALKQVI